jgi:polar amino acid transport system substrate-binding protein
VHRDDENLLAWLNLYLAKAEDNGFLEGLLDRYLRQNEWRNQQ